MKPLPTILLSMAVALVGFIVGRSNTAESQIQAQERDDHQRLSALDPANQVDPAAADAEPLPTVPESPAAAAAQIRGLLTQKQSVRRDLQFSLAALALDAQTLPVVWAELKAISEFTDYSNEYQLTTALLTRWAELDPTTAIEAALDMNGWMQYDAVGTIAGAWAKRDANAALAWIENSSNSRHREYAMSQVLSTIGKSDPSRALGTYLKAVDDNMRYNMLDRKTWDNPTVAAEQLGELPEGKRREESYSRVAHGWAQQNLDAARDWANGLPEGAERNIALSSVTQEWIKQDTEAATTWINELEPGDLRDQMSSKIANHHAQESSYEAALEAARQVADPHRRADTFESTLQSWLYRDPEAAREFIESSHEIDDGSRWRLLTPR